MPYFPVDDDAHAHPKFVMAGNAAIGLWTRCGSWSKKHTTGGWVPTDVARSFGTPTEIKKLVKVGLWEPRSRDGDPGYAFHDWTDAKGNGTAEEEAQRKEESRLSNAERQARWRAARKAEEEARSGVSHDVSNGVTNAGVTTPPSPTDGLDMTREPEVRPVATARLWTDQEVSDFVKARAKRARISNLGRIGTMLARTVDPDPLSPHAAVVLVESLLGRAKDEVRSVDGYVKTCVDRSPDEIRDLYESQDLAAISTPTAGAS